MTKKGMPELEKMLLMGTSLQAIGRLIAALHSFPVEHCREGIKAGKDLMRGIQLEQPVAVKVSNQIIDLTLNLVDQYRKEVRELMKKNPEIFETALKDPGPLGDILKNFDSDILH